MVNRMWAHFLGYGFTKPIDDIGPHNPPSHPELLDQLGKSFRESELRSEAADAVDRALGAVRLDAARWRAERGRTIRRSGPGRCSAGFYVRQMEAEQLYESLLVATGADETVTNRAARRGAGALAASSSTRRSGRTTSGESTTFNGSIPQALTLMNGELVRRATGNQPGSMLARVAGDPKMDNAEKIRYLYLAALSRRADEAGDRRSATSCWRRGNGNVARRCRIFGGRC